MRIAMVTTEFPRFSQTFVMNKFLGLLRRGWDVHIVAQKSEPSQWSLYHHLREVPDLRERIHVGEDPYAALLSLNPALVHFEFAFFAAQYLDIKQTLRCKVVISIRGYEPNFMRLNEPDTYAELWEQADGLHFLTEDLWRCAVRRGCPENKLYFIISPAIDTDYFRPHSGPTDGSRWSRERPYRLLSVGRLHWQKGFDYSLQAVRMLVDHGIPCEYRIVGEGDHRSALTFAIHDFQLEDVAALLGTQGHHQIRDHMHWADVFVHPALSEGFGNAVLEAQAMALPVVCTDAGGLPENVLHAKTGLVVPRRDAGALADSLLRLSNDDRLRRALGAAARERAERDFGLDAQVAMFESLYTQVAGSGDSATSRVRRETPDAEIDDGGCVDHAVRKLEYTLRREEARTLKLQGQLERARNRVSAVQKELIKTVDAASRDLIRNAGIKAAVEACTPPKATLIVVSRGDAGLLQFPERQAWHFPQGRGGVYAGHYPETSEEAIAHLEALRNRGGEFLLFPHSSFWWLDHYKEFGEYLSSHSKPVLRSDCCIIFGLSDS